MEGCLDCPTHEPNFTPTVGGDQPPKRHRLGHHAAVGSSACPFARRMRKTTVGSMPKRFPVRLPDFAQRKSILSLVRCLFALCPKKWPKRWRRCFETCPSMPRSTSICWPSAPTAFRGRTSRSSAGMQPTCLCESTSRGQAASRSQRLSTARSVLLLALCSRMAASNGLLGTPAATLGRRLLCRPSAAHDRQLHRRCPLSRLEGAAHRAALRMYNVPRPHPLHHLRFAD